MLVTQAKNEWYLSESSSFRLPDSIVHKDSFLLIFTALSGIFFVNAIQTRFPLSVGRQAFFPLGLQAGSGTGSPRAPIQTSACSWPGSAPPSHGDHRCWSAPEGCMFLHQVPDCHSGALQQRSTLQTGPPDTLRLSPSPLTGSHAGLRALHLRKA